MRTVLTAIDLFAGAGGFTTGATNAGLKVIWAANHNRAAVNIHARNHPTTTHVCQDLQLANWSKVPDHDILLASPCCQGHSKSKGNTKNWHHYESRQTAWCVREAVARKRPVAAIVENVPEFQNWNESDDKTRKGQDYLAWRDLMRHTGAGYHYSHITIDAADLGVPQNRERLFMVFLRADMASRPVELVAPDYRHVPYRRIMRPDRGIAWTRVDSLCERTKQFVTVAGRDFKGTRFLAPYFGSTRALGQGRSVDRPLGTLTTKDRYGLVSDCHKWLRMLTIEECRDAMGFPANYLLDERKTYALKQLGNAVVPRAAEWIIRQVVNILTGSKISQKVVV
jgi:DNA (cytosine-5)-methyltransferase 1